MKKILLTKGKFALVDDKDYEWLSQWKWSARRLRNSWYAQRNCSKTKKADIITMHRQILGLKKGDGLYADHINGNGLDNRRCNLRVCNNQQNHFNTRSTTGSSMYKGVCRVKRKQKKKWLAQIMHSGKHYFLGYYASEIEAAKVYDQKAIKLFGEFAHLNFGRNEVRNAG